MPVKVVSWNVNSYNVRLHHINDLLFRFKPDILFLQETRCDVFTHENYYTFCGPGRKGRNGVAIISKKQLTHVPVNRFQDRCVVAKDINDIYYISIYAPNGSSNFSPVSLRTEFFQFLIERFAHKKVVIGGDFNVVYKSSDYEDCLVYNQESVQSLQNLELFFRSPEHQYEKYITWYDYRDFKRSKGMGLDRFFLTLDNKTTVEILDRYLHIHKRSDHLPILLRVFF